jgi:tripeptidyl-peptidase I
MFVSATALTTLALLSHAQGVRRDVGKTVHEKRDSDLVASTRWHPTARLAPTAMIPIRIALTQSNLNVGIDRLLAISHPESTEYGRILAADEVNGLFAANDEAIDTVRGWLIASGVEPSAIALSDSKAWLAVDMAVADAEHLLDAEFYEYEHLQSGKHVSSHRCIKRD